MRSRVRLVLLAVLSLTACKRETATSPAAPSGKEKGARTDKPAMQAGAPIALVAVIDGKPAVTWTRAEMGKVKTISVAGDQGDEQRSAWSLRDVVTTLV